MENYFKWSKDFVTGIESIDSQHYRLVEIINRSLGFCFDEENIELESIDKLFGELSSYVVYHFEEEEKIMDHYQVDSRHVEAHKRTHKDFIEEVKRNFSDLNALTDPSRLEVVNELLIRWLAYHILNTDKSLVRQIDYIREEKLSPREAYRREENIVEASTEPLLKALRALFYIVSEKNKELERKNRELEEKVKERTLELESANKKLKEISIKDELTGLYNRRFIVGEIDILISNWRRYSVPFSVLFIDLDKFKSVNDNYGHKQGDRVLKWVAGFLKDNIRESDILGRLGGDEFVIICTHSEAGDAIRLGEKLSYKSMDVEEDEILDYWRPSFSIGVAGINEDIGQANDILTKADSAMYEVKKSGGNFCSIVK